MAEDFEMKQCGLEHEYLELRHQEERDEERKGRELERDEERKKQEQDREDNKIHREEERRRREEERREDEKRRRDDMREQMNSFLQFAVTSMIYFFQHPLAKLLGLTSGTGVSGQLLHYILTRIPNSLM
jgi:hypothetical protein